VGVTRGGGKGGRRAGGRGGGGEGEGEEDKEGGEEVEQVGFRWGSKEKRGGGGGVGWKGGGGGVGVRGIRGDRKGEGCVGAVHWGLRETWYGRGKPAFSALPVCSEWRHIRGLEKGSRRNLVGGEVSTGGWPRADAQGSGGD